MINVRIISDLLSLMWFSYALPTRTLTPISPRTATRTKKWTTGNPTHSVGRSPSPGNQPRYVSIRPTRRQPQPATTLPFLGVCPAMAGLERAAHKASGRGINSGKRWSRYWISDINLVPFMCNCNECAIVGGGWQTSFAFEGCTE